MGFDLGKLCGAEGIRTPDPLHAMEVRYQLRYSPLRTPPEGLMEEADQRRRGIA